jgi:hypothetical protein
VLIVFAVGNNLFKKNCQVTTYTFLICDIICFYVLLFTVCAEARELLFTLLADARALLLTEQQQSDGRRAAK